MSDEFVAPPWEDIAELRDLFEHAPCGYISAQANGRIARVNQTFLDWTGYAAEELQGRRFQDLLNIAGKIFYETHFAPLLRMQGHFDEVALDLVRRDGTTFPVLVNAMERRDEAGGLRFIRITIFNASDRRRYERDLLSARKAADEANATLRELNRTLEARVSEAVEEQLKAEESLRQAQKMEAVGRLTGGIAHDFNNMLAVVLSALSLLERRLANGDRDVGSYISAAKDGAGRAAALTRRLLGFARQQPLSPKPLDMNRVVSELSELLRRTLGETIQLEFLQADELWQVRADENQLENALVNLAVNARDAMPEGGRLLIETANCQLDEACASQHGVSPGQYVMTSVSDTGVGMSADVLSKAFEPFFTTKGVGKGTGLGLSQIFGFVKQSGGHIKIHSELGHGTTVKFYLPRFYGAADNPQSGRPKVIAAGKKEEVILLAEDNHDVLALTQQTLKELGYSVIPALNGANALRILEAHPEISLLFTDVVMPDMNGWQLAERARSIRPNLKVLFTTGYSRDGILPENVIDKGVALLMKPASFEQLAAKIREVLDVSD